MDFYLAIRKAVCEDGPIPIELDVTYDVKVFSLESGSVASHWVKVRFIGTVWYSIDNDLQSSILRIDYTDVFPLTGLPFDEKYMCNRDGTRMPFDGLEEGISMVKEYMKCGNALCSDYVLPKVAEYIGYPL